MKPSFDGLSSEIAHNLNRQNDRFYDAVEYVQNRYLEWTRYYYDIIRRIIVFDLDRCQDEIRNDSLNGLAIVGSCQTATTRFDFRCVYVPKRENICIVIIRYNNLWFSYGYY